MYGKYARGLFVRRTIDELDEVIQRSYEIYVPMGAVYKAQKHVWIFPNQSRLRMRYLRQDSDADHHFRLILDRKTGR